MSVKGLSDRRMPRVGKIRLGVKESKGDGQRSYPKAVDWFEVHADATTPAVAAEAFEEVYGDKPKVLNVMFVSDDPAHLPDPWYKMYGSTTGLICRGDGEEASARWDMKRDGQRPPGVEGGTWMTHQTEEPVRMSIPCLGDECPMALAKKCRMVLNLQFVLPDVRGIGAWQCDTGSYISVRNILDNVAMIQAAVGGVRGVPLTLTRVPKEVQPKGQAKKKTVFVLELSLPDVSLVELTAERAKIEGAAAGRLLLPPPIDENEAPDNLQEESDVDAGGMPDNVESGEVPMSDEEKQEATAAAEEMDPQVPEGTPEFETVGDLLTLCWQKHALDKTDVLKYSGLADIDAMVGLNLQHVYVRVMRKLEAAQAGAAS